MVAIVKKITDTQLLDILENDRIGLTHQQIADNFGVTRQAIQKRVAKLTTKIQKRAKQYATQRAIQTVRCLEAQALDGRTEASKILLELADVYTPKSIADINVNDREERRKKYEKMYLNK